MPRTIVLPDGTQIQAGDAIETYVSEEDKERTQKFDASLVFHKESYTEKAETEPKPEPEAKPKKDNGSEDEKKDGGLVKLTPDAIDTIEEDKIETVDPASGLKTRNNRKKKTDIAPITSVVENGNEVKVNSENIASNETTNVNINVEVNEPSDDVDLGFQVK